MGGSGRKNSMWKAAGRDKIPEPKFLPNAIARYLSTKNTRHNPLVDDVRSHLCYLGWKIEYLSCKGIFRYISPDRKLYMSLRKVCQDLISATAEISPEISQDDEQREPLFVSQGNNIASSPDDRQVSGFSPDETQYYPGDISPEITQKKPLLASQDEDDEEQVSGSSPSETEYYPEAVVYWYKHGLEKNRKCNFDMKLKAKKHLFALGWLCTALNRNRGLKLLRYTSPSGKNCNSLRTACKVCMDEGGLGEAAIDSSTKNSFSSAESSIISWSRKRRRKDNSWQLGSHSLQFEDNSCYNRPQY